MAITSTPATLLDAQASALRTQLCGVFDGDVEAVHSARVATRRIRELLRLVRFPAHQETNVEDIIAAFATIGRALGRVRDIDVRLALISDLETHTPQIAPSLVLVRQHLEADRLVGMRRLIKALENVEVDALLRAVSERNRNSIRMRLLSSEWRGQVRGHVIDRTRDAIDRIEHATGIYFPNRSHTARIAVKRLRYAAEIMEATGVARIQRAIKSLRKVQAILGDLHDRQQLADDLGHHPKRNGMDKAHLKIARQVLTADVQELYGDYLGNRAAVRAACAEIDDAAATLPGYVHALVIGTAVAVTGVAWTRWARTTEGASAAPRMIRPATRASA